MDIIDIILAKKLTPQGQIETYARTSQQAVANANQAVATVEAAAEDIEEKQAAANDLLEQAQEALQTAQEAQITMPEVYSTTGQNTDGYMTQKAVTDALDTKASVTYVNNNLSNKVDNSTLNNYATTTYVNQKIANIPSSSMPGGISNLGIDAAGKIVIVGPDGNIIAGDTSEASIIEALIKSGSYKTEGVVGLSIDYENKSVERLYDAVGYNAGSNFNTYSMYGGRMRCNVADDGTINAFYGDPNYTEDGSNGQVMVYQPKFYYQRIIIKEENIGRGNAIRKEALLLSDTPKSGFTIHPLFKKGEDELDYILLSAYEGCAYDTSEGQYITDDELEPAYHEDKLSSIAGVKPLSGINKILTPANAAYLAQNRGSGWTLFSAEADSAIQMLEIVEFGSLNGQVSLEKGVVNITKNNSDNCSAITGSTSSLGNNSGAAISTVIDNNGIKTTYSENGKRAISYRGMENPWGNLWRLLSHITIKGGGTNSGNIFYNENDIGITLPYSLADWISSMGHYEDEYNWIFMPIECNGNSAIPVGDALWTNQALNGENQILVGGPCNAGENAGIFYYSGDIGINRSSRTANARCIFIPTKNTIYNTNIANWAQHYGG